MPYCGAKSKQGEGEDEKAPPGIPDGAAGGREREGYWPYPMRLGRKVLIAGAKVNSRMHRVRAIR